ncbi:MAG: hypothetical protein COB93_00610 [Sneathiella sp.]|nr:MAG: hypothetical protein COB93_00610 [Sneathiella sp.]
MATRLRPPIGRLSQAMIVLGICAVLVGALLNIRDLAVVQQVEGQLLDWRFAYRGPMPADDKIALVVMVDVKKGDVVTATRIASVIEALVKDGAETIAIAPSLLDRMTATETAKLAASLAQVKKPLVGYIFREGDPGIVTQPSLSIPPAVRRNTYLHYRFPDGGTGRVLTPTGIKTPDAALLEAATPGHVTLTDDTGDIRRYAYPVMDNAGRYYPSLAVEASLFSLGLDLSAVSITFGRQLEIASSYIPTDYLTRVAVNYRGAAGTYLTYSFDEVVKGGLSGSTFKGGLVLIGATDADIGETFVSPFGGTMPDVEFLATVIDNLWHADPLDRSQQVIVLDIIMIALIGIFFGLLATLRNAGVVMIMAILAGGLVGVVNFQAFALLNLWLSLTFPLAAVILCTLYLVAAKRVSNRRAKALTEEERTETTKYATPWIAERVAKGRMLEEKSRDAAARETADEAPERAIDDATPEVDDGPLVLVDAEELNPEDEVNSPEFVPSPGQDLVIEDAHQSPTQEDLEAALTLEPPSEEEQSEANEPLLPVEEEPEPAPAPVSDPEPVPEPKPEPISVPLPENPPTFETAFSPAPKEDLISDDEPVSGRHFPVAILYVDMRGFNAAGKSLGPTLTAPFLNALHDLIEDEVVRDRGFVEKFKNDGIMAVFGLPDDSVLDARHALESARKIGQSLATYIGEHSFPGSMSLTFNIGVHFGQVSVDILPTDDSFEVSLSGDTMIIAACLQDLADDKSSRIIASSSLVDKIRGTDSADDVLKGFSEQSFDAEDDGGGLLSIWTYNVARATE